ncbi:MAG: LEA type 2 family protein [Bacteroidales bacterium]
MKKISSYLTVLTIVSLLNLLGCKPYESITVKEPEKIEIQSASLSDMDVKIVLPIHNPNIYPVKLKKIDATGYINNKKIGNIINNETLSIPANSDKSHDLEININYADLVNKNLPVMQLLREKAVTLEIKGTLYVKSFLTKKQIDFHKSQNINLNDLRNK